MEEENNCPICLESLGDGNELYSLNCKHVYHRVCITEWLKNHTTCPLCRENVQPDRRYVDDGIINEERLRDLIIIAIETIEAMFPQMEGWSIFLDRALHDPHAQELLREILNNPNSDNAIKQIMMMIGISGVIHYGVRQFLSTENSNDSERWSCTIV